ncbi:MAG: winged helix-turn-helix domain-containing tetratricopeptide repeat protein [Congregibacter sp.]
MSVAASDAKTLRIGEWELLPQRNLLRRAGQITRLEPKHTDLLLFLANHRGEVFNADQLIEQVWHGQVVTDQSVYQTIAKLRKAFGDNAADPRYIETVSKRGYRLIADVSALTDTALPKVPATKTGDLRSENRFFPRRWVAFGLLAVTLLVVAWALLTGAPPTEPPSVLAERDTVVAVLPFTVLSDDPDDELMAAGFAIELAHVLGRSGRIRVIGPVSSSMASRLGQDTNAIGQHVDASVVVSGTLRRSVDGIRVSSALTELPSGYQLWSEVFDRDDRQIVTAQEDVATAIAAALEKLLEGGTEVFAASTDVAQTADSATYDNYLLGRYYRHLRTEHDLKRARQYFQQALAADPDYAPALRELAATELLLFFYGSETLAEANARAATNLKRAMELDPGAPEGLALIGLSHYLQGNYGLAEDFLQRAVTAHPNLHEAWMWLGLTLQQQGRLHESLPALEYASQLEPLLVTAVADYAEALVWSGRDKAARILLENLAGKANASMGNRDQLFRTLSLVLRNSGELGRAFVWSERALEAEPNSQLSLANKVVLLTLFGRDDEAGQLASQLYEDAQPGRGTMQFLGRANIIAPGVLDHALLSAHLSDLQIQPDTPEIEWRLSNFDMGMAAYHQDNFERAAELLSKAMRGSDFPVTRADDDVYACASLADALGRIGKLDAAAAQLSECVADLSAASQHGWNSLSMIISEARLAVLENDIVRARDQLPVLFERGLRNAPILVNDPIIARLSATDEYQSLLSNIRNAVETARQSIDQSTSLSLGRLDEDNYEVLE